MGWLSWKKFFILAALVVAFTCLADSAWAQNNLQIGGTGTATFELFRGEAGGLRDYRQYIKVFYDFAIGAGVLVATILIMVGGVIWITSAGDQGKVTKAKEYIFNAIAGVVLLFAVYTILALINPAFVNLRLPDLPDLGFGACTWASDQGEGYINCTVFPSEEECTEQRTGEFHTKQLCEQPLCTPAPTGNSPDRCDTKSKAERANIDTPEQVENATKGQLGACQHLLNMGACDLTTPEECTSKGADFVFKPGETCSGRKITGQTKEACENLSPIRVYDQFTPIDNIQCTNVCGEQGCDFASAKDLGVTDYVTEDGVPQDTLECYCTFK